MTFKEKSRWDNCWSVTDENGNEQPDTYPTIEAAQSEIDELFEDIKYEITSGERSPDGGCQIICVSGHRRKLKCFPKLSFIGGHYGDTTRVVGGVVKRL